MKSVAAQGLELKIARLSVGMKQYELAARLGIGVSKLSIIESGRYPVSSEFIEKIKKVLDEAQGSKTKGS